MSDEEDGDVIFGEFLDEYEKVFDTPIAEPVPRADMEGNFFTVPVFVEDFFYFFSYFGFFGLDGGVAGDMFRCNAGNVEVFEEAGLVEGGMGGGISDGPGGFVGIGVVPVGGNVPDSFFCAGETGEQGAFGAGMEIHDSMDIPFFYFFPELEVFPDGHFAGEDDHFMDAGNQSCDFLEFFFYGVIYLTFGEMVFIDLECGYGEYDIAEQTQSNKEYIFHFQHGCF